jgi:transposase
MYWMLPNLQWCWAHLKRDFQALVEHPNVLVHELGQDLMAETDKVFNLWFRCRDGTLSRAGLKQRMQPVCKELESLLLRGTQLSNSGAAGMCRELTKYRHWLWTYLDVEGLGPTNNASERALRHAVIWRKLSFGTQSEKGSRFVETMLTVIETCRQQNRNVLQYVTSAVQAHFHSQPPASLLPRP